MLSNLKPHWLRTISGYELSGVQKFVTFSFLVFSFLFPLPIHANPEISTSSVTATVPGFPSSPILISPSNNSIINSGSPTFIFEPSNDLSGINKYELWIDGNFDQNISHSFTLTISTTATTALKDGLHTWKIRAVNNFGLSTDSATFSFIIDTTPPIILVTNIAEHKTNLSSQDPTTIPTNYSISTTDLTPTISGTSEANANLIFNFTGSIASYTLTAITNSNASFSLTPNFQLASDTYTISIISSDQALNSTSLPSFTLIIAPQIKKTPPIIIPLPSPLPNITIPGLPIIPQLKTPSLPKPLTAFPMTTDSPSILTFLPWLIIFLLILYIFIKKYITLYLAILTLTYLTIVTFHYLPAIFLILLLSLLVYLKKQNS